MQRAGYGKTEWRIRALSTPVSPNLHVSSPHPCSLLSLTREGYGSDHMELACGPSASQGDPISRVLVPLLSSKDRAMGLNHRDHWLISAIFQDLLPLLCGGGTLGLDLLHFCGCPSEGTGSFPPYVSLSLVCGSLPGEPAFSTPAKSLQVLPWGSLFTLESVASAREAATF